MSKNRDKIRVSFPSASAESVAGSQVLIEYGKGDDKQTILIECGLIQGETTLLKEYQANSKKFAFKPHSLTAVFSLHNHADHIGLLPRLYKEGCSAPLLIPEGNYEIMRTMLLDSAKIMAKDAEDLSKRFERDYEPIYDEQDVCETMLHAEEYPNSQKIIFNENITFEYIHSGHIINSYQLILWIKNNNTVKKIGITSDLGNPTINQYYTEPFEPIENANLLIGETTYCNPKRSIKPKDREKDLEKMKAAIQTVCEDRHSSVLIPAFSLQRFQVILTHLYDLFHEDSLTGHYCPEIYAASPLACKISELFSTQLPTEEQQRQWDQVKHWSKITFIDNFPELESRVAQNKPTVYVASAGMMNVGYSSYIAQKLLPGPNNMILFCGYMAEGTVGAKIKENKHKNVTINGRSTSARCDIMSLNSFTSHMQYNELLHYYSSYNFDKIALVHGEFKDKCIFAKTLQEEISKKNHSGKVICVNKSTELLI